MTSEPEKPFEADALSPGEGTEEKSVFNSQQGAYSWTDIFLGVLTAPSGTFKLLADPLVFAGHRNHLLQATVCVSICAATQSQGQLIASGEPFKVSSILVSVFGEIFFWLVLASLLYYLTELFSSKLTFARILILTGWAFVPLLLTGPCALFCRYQNGFQFLLSLLGLWFVILEFLAFRTLLKFGKLKALILLLLLPPVLFFTYLFWFGLLSVITISSLVGFSAGHVN